ncbi:MAG TPA: glycosyltransferase family 1 protein, partial [Ktedonobacterales bacterium]|nr:glycosyltransferase family 1 protein [Ktedonobacterales bacterium]
NAGVSRYTYRLIEGLAHQPTDTRYSVFVTAHDAPRATPFDPARVELVPARWPTARPPQRILWEQLALPGLLRRMRADVFHSTVHVLPERLPCPSVVTIHDLAFLAYPQFFRPARRLYQRIFTARSARAATRLMAVSESTKRDVVARLGIAPEKVRVVYPAIDARFRPVADPARLVTFRREQGLPDRFLLYLGTLEPRKNLAALLAAYALLRARDDATPPLVLAGAKGWYYQELFDRVRQLGLERSITFAGYVRDEDQPLWYAAAELFIYPSLFEGFGLPVAEALACGAPVVTTNVSSLPEAAGDVAMLADPHQPAALAHAMQSVLLSDETRRQMAARGPVWASRFTIDRMAAGCEAVYAEAAGIVRRTNTVEVG